MTNMVVVISDLHFEEEKTDILAAKGPDGGVVGLRRNVPGAFFEALMRDVVVSARARQAERIDFVLAGDVFDLHRSQLWFTANFSGVRPFVDNGKVGEGSPLEQAVLEMLQRIIEEDEVKRSLEAFQRLAQGFVLDGGRMEPIGIPVTMHYIPGNHDRLVNATPALRQRVRALLKLGESDEPFKHNIRFTEPNVFIRHGHEYDPTNFGGKLKVTDKHIDQDQPDALYDKATTGDFVTVQVASRLPSLFRAVYGDAAIAADPTLRTIYLRLLEFDDLRPQKAVVRFILDIRPPSELKAEFHGRHEIWQIKMWAKVEPVIRRLLDDVSVVANSNPDARAVVPRLARFALWLRPWRFGIPLLVMKFIGVLLGLIDSAAKPQLNAQREQALHGEGGADFMAAGHTHAPQVAHLYMDKVERKKFFVDTGTWRNAVLGSAKRRQFGRVNATTYVCFFGPNGPDTTRAFNFHSGMEQTWPVDASDL